MLDVLQRLGVSHADAEKVGILLLAALGVAEILSLRKTHHRKAEVAAVIFFSFYVLTYWVEYQLGERDGKAAAAELNKIKLELQTAKSQLQEQDLESREESEISSAGARLRQGFRPALTTLLEKMNSPNSHVREYAKSTLHQIGSDYDARLSAGFGNPAGRELMKIWINPPPTTLDAVMALIRSYPSVESTAAAFSGFREMTGSKVSTFDIPAAEQWCEQHKPRCD